MKDNILYQDSSVRVGTRQTKIDDEVLSSKKIHSVKLTPQKIAITKKHYLKEPRPLIPIFEPRLTQEPVTENGMGFAVVTGVFGLLAAWTYTDQILWLAYWFMLFTAFFLVTSLYYFVNERETRKRNKAAVEDYSRRYTLYIDELPTLQEMNAQIIKHNDEAEAGSWIEELEVPGHVLSVKYTYGTMYSISDIGDIGLERLKKIKQAIETVM